MTGEQTNDDGANDADDTDKGSETEQTQDRSGDIKSMERALRKANKEAEASRKRLAELEDQGKTELQRATDQATEASRRAEAAETELRRLRIGVSKGLPADLAARLQGDSDEDLEADADRLLELTGASKKKSTDSGAGFDGGARPGAGKPGDMNQVLRRAAGRG